MPVIEPGHRDISTEVVFESTVPIPADAAEMLVIHCSQHDYIAQIADLVKTHLRRESFYPIAVPGGPHFFLTLDHLPKFAWAGKHWTNFLIAHKRLSELVLIAHEHCAWVQAVGSIPDATSLRVYTIRSLAHMHHITHRLYPRLDIRSFYAERSGNTPTRFLKVG